MTTNYLLLSPYFLALFISVGVTAYVFMHRNARGAFTFLIFSISGTVYVAGFLLETFASTLSGKLLWDNVQWLPTLIIPGTYLYSIIEFTGSIQKNKIKTAVQIFAFPAFFGVLVILDPWLKLIRPWTSLVQENGITSLYYPFTTVIYLFVAYTIIVWVYGLFVLIRAFRDGTKSHQRPQLLVLLAGLLTLISSAALVTLQLVPAYLRDINPLSFGVANLILTVGIYRTRLFNVIPTARELVVENLETAIIVLDAQNSIVDMNVSALNLLSKTSGDVLGARIEDVFADYPQLLEKYINYESVKDTIRVDGNGTTQYFDLGIKPIHRKPNKLAGRLVALQNITERKRSENELDLYRNHLEELVEKRTNELSQRADQMSALYDIGLTIASELDLNQILRDLFEKCRQLLPVDMFYIAVYDQPSGTIRHPLFYDGNQKEFVQVDDRNIETAPGLSGHVILSMSTLYLPDRDDPAILEKYQVVNTGSKRFRSYVGAPMIFQDAVIGVISMQNYESNAYSPEQIRLLETIATQAAIAIENARLYQAEQERRREAETLRNSLTNVVMLFGLEDIVNSVLDQIKLVIPYDTASVWRVDGEWLEAFVARDLPPDIPLADLRIRLNEDNSGTLLLQGEIPFILNNNVQEELRDFSGPHSYINSWLTVPLKKRDKIIGQIALDGRRKNQFNSHHAELAVVFANQVAIALENASLYEEVQQELSERKRTEQALRFSEEKFSRAFHTTPVMMTLEDTDAHFIEVNNAFLEITGYSRDEVIGHRPSEFNLIPDLEEQIKALKLLNEKGPFESLELGIRRKSGEIGTVLMSIELIQVNDMRYVLTSALDITERKQAEDTLRQRDAILQVVAHAAQVFLQSSDWREKINQILEELGKTTDASHVYIFQNHVLQDGTEVTSQKYEWSALNVQPEIDNPNYQNMPLYEEGAGDWVNILRNGNSYARNINSLSEQISKRTQERGIKSILDVPIFVSGKWWGEIGFDDMENVRDWTASEIEILEVAARMIGAAIEREQIDESLRTSEELYRRAIEAAGAVPYYRDYCNNTYSFMGEGILQVTGYSSTEMTPALWDSLEQEQFPRGMLAHLPYAEAVRLNDEGVFPLWECDYRILTKDGQSRWVSDSSVKVRVAQGKRIGVIGILQDVTERKQAEVREIQRRAMLEKIVKLGKLVTEAADLKTTLTRIWHGIRGELGFDRLAIFLYEEKTHSVHGTLGTDNHGNIVEEWEYSRSLSQAQPTSFIRALENPDGVYFTNNFAVEFDIPEGNEMYEVKDYASVTAWGGKKPAAIICVDNLPSQRSITQESLEALRLFAGYAGLAIENSRLNIELENRVVERTAQLNEANKLLKTEKARIEQVVDEVATLRRLSDFLQASVTTEEAGGIIRTHLHALFPNTSGALLLSKSGTTDLSSVGVWGDFVGDDVIHPGACWGMRRGRIYSRVNGDTSPVCVHFGSEPPHESICIPLLAQGETMGMICLQYNSAGSEKYFNSNAQELALASADSIALALANLRLREHLQAQSIRDGLTGLFNRRYHDETLPRELHRAERKKQSACVIMFDIDYFKKFNDTMGHDAGDVVLKSLANLVLSTIRSSDIACRYGGEEFTVILPDTTLDVARERAEQLRLNMSKTILKHNGQDLGKVTLSLGISAYPQHGMNRDELMKNADTALYKAKENGRNQVVICD